MNIAMKFMLKTHHKEIWLCVVWLHTKSYLLDFSNNDIFASCYLLSLTRSSKRRDVFCENI